MDYRKEEKERKQERSYTRNTKNWWKGSIHIEDKDAG